MKSLWALCSIRRQARQSLRNKKKRNYMVSSQRVFYFSLERTQLNNFIKRTWLLAKSHFYVEPAGCHTQLTALILIHLVFVCLLASWFWWCSNGGCINPVFILVIAHANTHSLQCGPPCVIVYHWPLCALLPGFAYVSSQFLTRWNQVMCSFFWYFDSLLRKEREREGEDLKICCHTGTIFFVVYLYTSPSSWEFLSPVDILSFFTFLSLHLCCTQFFEKKKKKSLPFS